MPDEPRRRVSDAPIVTRLALAERDIDTLGHRMDGHMVACKETHERLIGVVEKLDDRTDALTTRISVAFGIVGALWAAITVLAPFIRDFLRLPT